MGKLIAFDHIILAAIAQELKEELFRTRIEKVWAPSVDTLALRLWGQGRSRLLLISIHPRFCRVHLTSKEPLSPGIRHPFVLLLKKYLDGAKLVKIETPSPLERILHLAFEGTGPTGEPVTFILCAEIMGKHSNIILWEELSRKILGTFKTVTETQSIRPVYGGIPYLPPPRPEKKTPFVNPLAFTQELLFGRQEEPEMPLPQWMQNTFSGVMPLIATFMAGNSASSSLGSLSEKESEEIGRRWENFWNLYQREEFNDLIHLLHPHWKEGQINRQVAEYFDRLEQEGQWLQLSSRLKETLRKAVDKTEKEIRLFIEKLSDAEKAEQLQIYGELLKGGLYSLKKGDIEWTGINYFDPEAPSVTISLDPRKSPQENMNGYFKKYRKAANSLVIVKDLLGKKEEERIYLENVAFSVEASTSPEDLLEVERELEETGYLKPSGKARKKPVQKELHLLKFTSSEGYEILAGKNNIQNDFLTGKIAKDHDLWLHALGMPGSHVVIRVRKGESVPDATLLEAAGIAAYLSKGRTSAKVPVLYTQARYVTKIKGAKPGLVRYEKEKSLVVAPQLLEKPE